MSLYKYTTADNGLNILLKSKIRFTQPLAFNDPFDSYPLIEKLVSPDEMFEDYKNYNEGKEKEELELLDSLCENVGLPFLSNDQCEDEEYETRRFEKYKESMSDLWNSIGILCLSGNKNDTLMWSHYADSHQGVLLEIEKESDFLNIVKKNEGIPCDKVTYSDRRPFKPDRKDINFYRFNKLKDFLYVKYCAWEYEQEYRLVRCFYKRNKNNSILNSRDTNGLQKELQSSFSKADAKMKVSDKEYEIFLYEFPLDIIKSITFGCRISEEKKNEYMSLLNSDRKFNHIIVYQADTNSLDYKLNYTQISKYETSWNF